MNVIIFSKPNCPFCAKAKNLLRQNNIAFGENVIGEDIIREEFVQMYPNVKTVPYIIIDGSEVGGYTELVEWFNHRPTLLEG